MTDPVAVVSAVVHVLYLGQGAGDPTFRIPLVDAMTYDDTARQILSGHLSPDPYFQPPLLPYLLAGIYAVEALVLLAGLVTLGAGRAYGEAPTALPATGR